MWASQAPWASRAVQADTGEGPAGRRALAGVLRASLLAAQVLVATRVLTRLVRTAGGRRIVTVSRAAPANVGAVSALVPVLNERRRLGPCLDGLIVQGPELREIVVVDGGSTDGTQRLVRCYQERDPRVRLLDASPVPAGVNGKAWGLQAGLEAAASARWLLTIDADTRPGPALVASLLAHAARTRLSVLSVATRQELPTASAALVHPALLATLVYRFGIPGHAARQPARVQANGQCMLIRRDLLERVGGFAVGLRSPCEDVTIARRLAAAGWPVGFYESADLISVQMYESGWDAFVNWTRSLPLRDGLTRTSALVGLLDVALVQALPLPLVLALLGRRPGRVGGALLALNLGLLAARLGVLVGIGRAYCQRPWTYWLSPLLDVPVTLQLWRSALARRHHWRGRELVCGEAA